MPTSMLALGAVLAPAVLLAGVGSVSLPVTLTVLDNGKLVTVTLMVTMLLALGASVPRVQVTTPLLCAQVGVLGTDETKVTPAGKVSVTVTPVAVDGPLLVAVMV